MMAPVLLIATRAVRMAVLVGVARIVVMADVHRQRTVAVLTARLVLRIGSAAET